MEQKKNPGKSIWKKGYFAETLDPKELEGRMRTFQMKHDEEMNFNCKNCDKNISAHNQDWHEGMCDSCFDAGHFPDDEDEEMMMEELWEEELDKIEAMSPEEREAYTKENPDNIITILENFFLSANHYVFDDDWNWQIRHEQERSSGAKKTINVAELRQKYEHNRPEMWSRAIYAEETEDTKNMNALAEEDEEVYSEVVDMIHLGLREIAEENNDLGLIEALKQVKSNILDGNKEISREAISIKFAVMPALLDQEYSKKEVILCLQYFIKQIKNTRNNEGKNAFVKSLLEEQDEDGYDDKEEEGY